MKKHAQRHKARRQRRRARVDAIGREMLRRLRERARAGLRNDEQGRAAVRQVVANVFGEAVDPLAVTRADVTYADFERTMLDRLAAAFGVATYAEVAAALIDPEVEAIILGVDSTSGEVSTRFLPKVAPAQGPR